MQTGGSPRRFFSEYTGSNDWIPLCFQCASRGGYPQRVGRFSCACLALCCFLLFCLALCYSALFCAVLCCFASVYPMDVFLTIWFWVFLFDSRFWIKNRVRAKKHGGLKKVVRGFCALETTGKHWPSQRSGFHRGGARRAAKGKDTLKSNISQHVMQVMVFKTEKSYYYSHICKQDFYGGWDIRL